MTQDANVPSLDSFEEDGKVVTEYTPSDSEIQKTLNKAKEMDSKIMKEIHPEEYKKQEELKKRKTKEEKEYKELMQQRMLELKQEVGQEIGEFMDTTQ